MTKTGSRNSLQANLPSCMGLLTTSAFDFSQRCRTRETLPVLTFRDLKIQTKDKRVLTLTPNPVQETYLDLICPNWRQDDYRIDGLREQILKARQEGFSTIIAALLFLNTYNQRNVNTVVIADDMDNSENLFKKVRTMYDNLDDSKKLPTDYAGKRVLSWPALKSSYQVLTAGKKAAGRSRTINYLHMSERPFWPDSEILTGLLPTVPAEGAVFDESTANGEGNQYHEDYKRAKAGFSTYTPRFFAWFENPEYSLEPPAEFAKTGSKSDAESRERFGDEEMLAARFGLTDAQVYWRRRKMMEPGQGPLFRQEYPSDDVEAFLVSGSRFFEDWHPDVHTCLPRDIPAHWYHIAAYDWGYAAPCCLLLGAVDELGNVVIYDEMYDVKVDNDDQAQNVHALLDQYGLFDRSKQGIATGSTVIKYRLPLGIAADSSMWAVKRKETGQGYSDVDAFHRKGLPFRQAVKNEQGAWSNVRKFLAKPGGLTIFRGRCPNLIRTMPMMKHNPLHPERMAETWENKPVEDHAPATLSYLLNQHLKPAEKPYDGPSMVHERLRLIPYTQEEEHW